MIDMIKDSDDDEITAARIVQPFETLLVSDQMNILLENVGNK